MNSNIFMVRDFFMTTGLSEPHGKHGPSCSTLKSKDVIHDCKDCPTDVATGIFEAEKQHVMYQKTILGHTLLYYII